MSLTLTTPMLPALSLNPVVYRVETTRTGAGWYVRAFLWIETSPQSDTWTNVAELMQPVTYDDNGANGYIELDLQPYLNGHLSYSVPNPDGNQVQVMRGVSKRYRVEFFEWRYDDLELHVKLYHEGGSAQYYDIAALEDAQDYLLVTDAAPTDLTIRDGSTTVNAAAPSNYHVGSGSSRKIGQRWHQSVLTDSAAYDEIQVPSGVNVWIYKWVKRTHYRDTRDTYALKAGMSTELRLLPLAAPATPTGLAATPDSDTEVTVTWTDASSNETGFVLERSLDQTTWAEVATLAAGATSYGDTGLSAGTTYYYRVKAVAGAKASSWSNTASVTTYTPIVLTVQTDNAGVSSSTQFAIPLVSTGTYDFFVQWGDGSTSGQITTYNDAELTHTYSSAGSKTVRLIGLVNVLSFNNGGDCLKLTGLSDWGNLKPVGGMFHGCANLTITATNAPDTSSLNSLTSCFEGCTALTDVPGINNWNTGGVKNMAYCFKDSGFNGDVSGWDTSSCTSFRSTFENCPFDGSVNSWYMGAATTLQGMFKNNTAFDRNVNGWTFGSGLVNLDETFNGATSFNRPVSNWDVSNVTSAIGTFQDTTAYNQNMDAWATRVGNIVNCTGMFRRSAQNSSMSNWALSSCLTATEMFRGGSINHSSLNTWDVSNIINLNGFFQESDFNQSLNGWVLTAATNVASMFQKNTVFNSAVNGWGSSFGNVTNMSLMFEGCTNFNQAVNGLDTGSVTNMFGVFSSSGFDRPVNNWDVRNVTSFYACFQNSSFNQSLSGWQTLAAVNMQQMFTNNPAFDQSLAGLDMSNVTNCNRMLENTGMSTAKYDLTLIGWEGQTLQSNVTLGANGLLYTSAGPGGVARNNIITGDNWTIIGDSGI